MTVYLKGIRIIQTASAAAVPMAARLLADRGANVVCVEHTARKEEAVQRRDVFQAACGSRSIASYIDYGAQNHQRSKFIPHHRALTLWAAKGLSPFGIPE